eukprot:scaffold1768_cov116-Isochrysis_galbana.AAC.8
MLGYRDSARDIGPRKATVAARRPPHLRPLRRRLEFSAAPHALAQVVTPERALARYALGEFRRSTKITRPEARAMPPRVPRPFALLHVFFEKAQRGVVLGDRLRQLAHERSGPTAEFERNL